MMDKSTNVRAAKSKTSRKSKQKSRVVKHVLNKPRLVLKDKIEKSVSQHQIKIQRTGSDSDTIPSRSRPCKLVAIEYDASKNLWKLQETDADTDKENNSIPPPSGTTQVPANALQQEEDAPSDSGANNKQISDDEHVGDTVSEVFTEPTTEVTEDVGKLSDWEDKEDATAGIAKNNKTVRKTGNAPGKKRKFKYKKRRSSTAYTSKESNQLETETERVSTKPSKTDRGGDSETSETRDESPASKSVVQSPKAASKVHFSDVNTSEESTVEKEPKSSGSAVTQTAENDEGNSSSSEASEDPAKDNDNNDNEEESASALMSTQSKNWPYSPSEIFRHPSEQYSHLFSHSYDIYNRPSWDASPYNPSCNRPAWDHQLYIEAKERFRRHETVKYNNSSRYKFPWFSSSMGYYPPGTSQLPLYDIYTIQNQSPYSQYRMPQKMLRSSTTGRQLSYEINKRAPRIKANDDENPNLNVLKKWTGLSITNDTQQNHNGAQAISWTPTPTPASMEVGYADSMTETDDDHSNHTFRSLKTTSMSQGVQTPKLKRGRSKFSMDKSRDSSVGSTRDSSADPSRVTSFSHRRTLSSSWRERQEDHRKRIREERRAEQQIEQPVMPMSMSPLPRVALLSKPNSRVARSGNGGYYSPSMATTAQVVDESGRMKPTWDPSPFVPIGKKNAWDDTIPRSDNFRLQYFRWRKEY